MRAVFSIAAAFMVLCAGAAARTARADVAADEIKKLQGTWVISSVGHSATQPSEAPGRGDASILIIEGDQMKLYDAKGMLHRMYTIQVDPSKEPAWIDMVEKKNPSEPGIYKLDGNKLQLCLSDGKKRPTEVAPGAHSVLITMKRL